jgi:hypothetical protein
VQVEAGKVARDVAQDHPWLAARQVEERHGDDVAPAELGRQRREPRLGPTQLQQHRALGEVAR